MYVITLLDKLGGAEKNLKDIVCNLDRSRFEPYVFCFKGGYVSSMIEDAGIYVKEIGVTKILCAKALRLGWELRKFLRENSIDIVVTYHHDADIWGGVVALLSRTPVIISSRRDMGYQLQKKHIWAYRLLNRLYSKTLVNSEASKKEIMKREWTNSNDINIIYNGLSFSQMADTEDSADYRNATLRSLGVDPSKIILGMIASFRPIKGQEYFVEAISEVVKKRDDVFAVIVGEKETKYFEQVNGLIEKLGLKNHIACIGARSDAQKLLKAFDIFVLSSLSEGFSNAIIEAMQAGLPVIASDSGGNPEAVTHNSTGLLFPPKDSKALSRSILQLADDVKLRKEMGVLGRKRVEETFTLPRMVDENQELYLSLLNSA